MTLYQKKKLILRLDANVIEKAKVYASNNETSLSQLVELFLNNLTKVAENSDEDEHSELVQLLSGIIPQDINLALLREKHHQEKYDV